MGINLIVEVNVLIDTNCGSIKIKSEDSKKELFPNPNLGIFRIKKHKAHI